jgi:tyrosyl-tRNA synthetase
MHTYSIADGKRLINSGGMYINKQRVQSSTHTVGESDLIGAGSICILRTGKKNYHLIHLS